MLLAEQPLEHPCPCPPALQEEDGDAPSSAVDGPSQPRQAQHSQRRRRPARRSPSYSNTTPETDAEWSGWSSGGGSDGDQDDDACSLLPTLVPGGPSAGGGALAACGETCAGPRCFTHTLQRTDTANSATGLTQQLAELLGPVAQERGQALGAPPLAPGTSGGSLWPAGMVPADELGPARCSGTSLADLLAGDGQEQQQERQQLAAEVQMVVEREEWPARSGLPPPFQGLCWQQQAAGCPLGAWRQALGGSGLAVGGLPAAPGLAQGGSGLASNCARAPSPGIMHWLGLDEEDGEEEEPTPASPGPGVQEEGATAQGGGGQLPPPIPGVPVCEAAAAPCAAKHTAPAASLVAPAAGRQPGRDTPAASSERQHQGPRWQPPRQTATAPAPAPCPLYAGAMSYVAAAAAAMAAAGPAPAPSSARLPGTPLAAAAWGSAPQPSDSLQLEPGGSGACPLFFMDGAGRIRLGLPSASSSTAGTVPLPVLLGGAGPAASRGPVAAAAAPYFSALTSAQATPRPCG